MSILSTLLGSSAAAPLNAIGTVFDKLFTSDEERLQAEAVMRKLAQHPSELQVELNKIEASHRTVFVAGWRPFIGWVCGLGLAWHFIGSPIFEWAVAIWWPGTAAPEVLSEGLIELVLAMLGMAGLRTYDKKTGKAL